MGSSFAQCLLPVCCSDMTPHIASPREAFFPASVSSRARIRTDTDDTSTREAGLTTRRRGLLFAAHSRISWVEVGRRSARNRAGEKRAKQQALRQHKGRMKARATKATERRPMVMHVVVSRQEGGF